MDWKEILNTWVCACCPACVRAAWLVASLPILSFPLLSGPVPPGCLPGDQRAGRALKTVSSTVQVPAHLVEDTSQKALIKAEFIQISFPSTATRGKRG